MDGEGKIQCEIRMIEAIVSTVTGHMWALTDLYKFLDQVHWCWFMKSEKRDRNLFGGITWKKERNMADCYTWASLEQHVSSSTLTVDKSQWDGDSCIIPQEERIGWWLLHHSPRKRKWEGNFCIIPEEEPIRWWLLHHSPERANWMVTPASFTRKSEWSVL